MKWTDLRSESCPVVRGLSVVGDRWTLLILRDCFFGFRRFEQFQERLGVTRHVLIDRLRKLESVGVLHRQQYQDRPPRFEYRLTEAGEALYPTLVTLIAWAEAHVPPQDHSDITLTSRTTGEVIAPQLIDTNSGQPITCRSVTARRPRPADTSH